MQGESRSCDSQNWQPPHEKGVSAAIARFVVQRSKLSLLLITIFILSLLPGLKNFEEQYDARVWFRESDPNIQILNAFERQFGNDENLVVVMATKQGILTPKYAQVLHDMTEKMWTLPQVLRVDSLSNYQQTTGSGDDILVENFLDNSRLSDSTYLDQKLTQALAHRVLPNYLISKDGKNAMIFARLVPTLKGSPNYRKIIEATRRMIKEYQTDPELKLFVTGEAAVNDSFREVSNRDTSLILPILFLLIIILLLFVFRSLSATVLPLLLMGTSIGTTLGLCFYLGMKFNEILTILPGIMVAVGIADSVHIIATFFQFKAKGMAHKEAVYCCLIKNILPTFLTSFSTTLGFFSLLTTELVPIRQLGFLAGTGTLFAWLITMFLICPLLVLLPIKVPKSFKRGGGQDGGHRYWERLCAVATVQIKKFRYPIFIVFVGLSIVSLIYGLDNEINSNPYLYFKPKVPLRVANDYVLAHFGGSTGPELVISAGVEDGIKDPVFLKKVEAYKNWIESLPYVNKTVDITDIIKEMNQALFAGKASEYKLPDSKQTIAEELFMYTMGLPQGMDLNNRMTLKKDALRMSVLWNLNDTRSWLRSVSLLEDKAKDFGLDLHATGKFLLFQRMMDYVVLTFFKSITLAMILVGILMMILLRSVKLGLLSMAPNILPLFFGAAFMKLMGMQLNIGTALVASVTLGIAVDDTIHFLTNFYRLKKAGQDEDSAIKEIFTYTGMALIFTTVILVLGFGLFIFGDFIPNINFGLLCAMVLMSALLADLIFLPALLFIVADFRNFFSPRKARG